MSSMSSSESSAKVSCWKSRKMRSGAPGKVRDPSGSEGLACSRLKPKYYGITWGTRQKRSRCWSSGVHFVDYYRLLGVDPRSDEHTIRSAYRRFARRYHPDVAKGKDAARRFLLIREAYGVLSDPQKRGRYDQLFSRWTLASRSSREQAPASASRTVSQIELSAPGRRFRLVIEALGIRIADIRFGGSRSVRSRVARSPTKQKPRSI